MTMTAVEARELAKKPPVYIRTFDEWVEIIDEEIAKHCKDNCSWIKIYFNDEIAHLGMSPTFDTLRETKEELKQYYENKGYKVNWYKWIASNSMLIDWDDYNPILQSVENFITTIL